MATDASTLLSRVASRGLYGIEHTNVKAAQDYAECNVGTGGTASTLMTGVASNKLYGLAKQDLRRVLVYLLSQGQASTTAQQLMAVAAANGFYGLCPLDLKRCILAMLRYSTICSGVPLAPTNLTVLSTTSSSITIQWSQPLTIPVTPISSYTVKYGTSSGVYTTTITGLPSGVFSYTITGLTASTAYFIVVQAVNGVCPSAASSQLSTSTSSASNGLLTNLISYWKFDVNVSPYADSVGTNNLTGSGTSAGLVAGIINGGLDVSGGGSQAAIASNSDVMPGAGVSLSISGWFSASDWSVGGTGAFPNFLRKGDNSVLNSYTFQQNAADRSMALGIQDSSSTFCYVQVAAGALTANVYHHLVLVFDANAKTVTAYLDGVNKGSTPTNTNQIINGAQNFIVGPGVGFASWLNLRVDELALWHKSLTQTDVTNLYNGGAALPLSSFS